MTNFDFTELAPNERYKMLCAAVIPRPVAWITSLDADGIVNAAPFSFFNVFAEDPPIIIVGLNRRPTGDRKDTLNNIDTAGEFAVNLADSALVEKLVACASEFPPGISEPSVLGLPLAPGSAIKTPHLADAPVSLECRVFDRRDFGNERHLVFGEVVGLNAREGLFDPETKRMTVPHYDPVARLYATSYAKLGPAYDIPIPAWQTLMPQETK